jgi:hypothetical protein
MNYTEEDILATEIIALSVKINNAVGSCKDSRIVLAAVANYLGALCRGTPAGVPAQPMADVMLESVVRQAIAIIDGSALDSGEED